MNSFLRFAFVFIVLAGGAGTASAEDPDILAWHKVMTRRPLPKKERCFTVTYPNTQWVEEACATPPRGIWRFAAAAQTADTPSAKVMSGPISTAIGSFDRVSLPDGRARDSTVYSLQINSEHFDTPLCDGAEERAKCKGWQQFMYIPNNSGFVQYWLLHYGPNCPEGWMSKKGGHCMRFGNCSVPPGNEPLSDLIHMSFGGTAVSSGEHVLTVGTPGHKLHACKAANILGLATAWRVAQFGVFGDENGHELELDGGTTLVVRTTVYNGTKKRPACVEMLVTGETHNLEFVPPCQSQGGEAPAIVFTLSNERHH